jgi:hypothetical protein
MKSPFWMLFGPGLEKIFCDHKGEHDEWGYKLGSGITELHCSKCGRVIKRVALDDLPKDILEKLINMLQDDEPDE